MTIPTSSNPEAISYITAIISLSAWGSSWGWSGEQSSDALAAVHSLIGASLAHFTTTNPLPLPTLEPKPTRFPHITTLPRAVLATGWQ